MSGKDENLYPIAMLIDELKNEDVSLRLNSTKRLSTISVALGPDRTRDELLPFLTDLIEDEEDEVLQELASQLTDGFIELVGGHEFASSLLTPLVQLCSVEESTVRERAVASICAISRALPPAEALDQVFPVLRQLGSSEWVTSRSSSCGIFAALYSSVPSDIGQEMREMYNKLCHDESPMVRRSACTELGKFAQTVDREAIRSDLMPCLLALSQDNQDSVRLLSIDAAVSIAKRFSSEDAMTLLFSPIKALSEDRSWRVRYMVANAFHEIVLVFGTRVARYDLKPLFVTLCKDSEAEVRTSAASQVSKVCSVLTQEQILDFLNDVQVLTQDVSQHVRTSLASDIMGLAPLLGRQNTLDHLLPLYLTLLRDEFYEVRLNVISKIEDVNKVIGVDLLAQSVLPSVMELARDPQWRVRLAIIDYVPLLANELGISFFDSEIVELCLQWLMDQVYSVRETCWTNLRKVVETFGNDWAQKVLLPRMAPLADNQNYLFRMTLLFTLSNLATVMSADAVVQSLLPLILKLAHDRVANVRFNVAKSLQAIIPVVEPQIVTQQIKPCLLSLNEDSDIDVKYYASLALQLC